MKKYKIKTIFLAPKGPKTRANNAGIDIMIFILIFVKNCRYYDAKHDFSVWPRTGSNPADIHPFRSHTG